MEWKEVRLGDVCEIFVGGDAPKGNMSKTITCKYNIPIYSNGITDEGLYGYTDKARVFEPASTITARGTIGVVFRRRKPYFPIVRLISVIGNKEIIDSDFLYYSLKNTYIDGEGSVQAQLTVPMISNYRINLPSLPTQQAIASILSSLDAKIENNRKICANLEAQAQALFKHWFIDFAPFKDGKFVESELGMIPEGWRVGTYSDIIQETISGDWGKENNEGNYSHKVACIRGCDFQDIKMGLRGKTPERYILEKNFQSKHFEDKDILVEISGGTATVSTGRVCPISQLLIDRYNGDIVCSNFCRLVRPRKGYSSYLYYSWKYKYDHKVMFGYENGTSGIKNFSIKDFTAREQLILPNLSALNEFETLIEHIHSQIQNYGSESSRLATLRDTLLPKLMSGQIKV